MELLIYCFVTFVLDIVSVASCKRKMEMLLYAVNFSALFMLVFSLQCSDAISLFFLSTKILTGWDANSA